MVYIVASLQLSRKNCNCLRNTTSITKDQANSLSMEASGDPALKGVSKMTSYEEHVLTWLRRELIEHDHQIGQGGKHISVEEIRFEPDGPEGDMIVILFREVRRPQCLFGFRIGSREPPPVDKPDWQWRESEDPEGRFPRDTLQSSLATSWSRLRRLIWACRRSVIPMGLPGFEEFVLTQIEHKVNKMHRFGQRCIMIDMLVAPLVPPYKSASN